MNEQIAFSFCLAGGTIDCNGNTKMEDFDPELFAQLVVLRCCDDIVQAANDKSLEQGNPSDNPVLTLIKNTAVHFSDYLKWTNGMKELACWL